jgi:2-oxoglutarate dehydrogenase E1 component
VPRAASASIRDVAIVRLEQLYPFPHGDFEAEMERYPQGAGPSSGVRRRRATRAPGTVSSTTWPTTCARARSCAYALRPSSASPRRATLSLHAEQQRAVIDAALTV